MVDILLKNFIYETCLVIFYDVLGSSFSTLHPIVINKNQLYDTLVVRTQQGNVTYRDVTVFQCVGDMLVFSHTDYVSIDDCGVITYQKCLKVANLGSVITCE